jgi:hypothetical protein
MSPADAHWLRRAAAACGLAGLLGGILGWLMYTEDDQEA